MRTERIFVVLCALGLAACRATAPADAADGRAGGVPETAEAAGMVEIRALVPDIALDIRYAGKRNFTGGVVDGYEAPACYLLRPVAEALRDVEARLREQGLRLRIFDCYRPARAVRHFVRWSHGADDPATRAGYHPSFRRSELIPGGYIADRSGHSRGATVDLTLMRCDDTGACVELDMGTSFDFFDPRANTDHPGLGASVRANRDLLRGVMARHGFANYPMEWWHYTFRLEPPPEIHHDFPVR